MSFDITMEFMPIYDAAGGRVHGFEALARGPKGEHFADLYASARQAGALAELDRECLRAALPAATLLKSNHRMFVTVLPSSIAGGHVLSELENVAARPEQIVLEVLPFELPENRQEMTSALAAIVERGYELALDGFGTGYSSFASLTEAPYHFLKAARDVIDEPEVLQSVGAMAKSLELLFVVTGIESETQLEAALTAGADLVQGHYLAKPSREIEPKPFQGLGRGPST